MFIGDIAGFVDALAPAGAANGLVQALLRCTSPGLPDLYQGTEFWDFSLVDPDNRRPVDFEVRRVALGSGESFDQLRRHWRDGRVKQRLIATALDLRRRRPGVMGDGGYTPLEVEGRGAGRLIVYLRHGEGGAVLVAAVLNASAVIGAHDLGAPSDWWAARRLDLPPGYAERSATDSFSGARLTLDRALPLQDVFRGRPVAILEID